MTNTNHQPDAQRQAADPAGPEPHPKHAPTPPATLGWREFVALPDWGVRSILAKADTGAHSSAVHAENIDHRPDGRVEFDLVYGRANNKRRRVQAQVARTARVRSSNGTVQERTVVLTTLDAGGVRKPIEVTLVSRDLMRCRMLLGRTALAEDFLIDPAQRHRLREAKQAAGDNQPNAAEPPATPPSHLPNNPESRRDGPES